MCDNFDEDIMLNNIKDILFSILEIDDPLIPISKETVLISGSGDNYLSLSSIDYVDFLTCIEDEYDIIYDFNARLYTIGDVIAYIIAYKQRLEGGC